MSCCVKKLLETLNAAAKPSDVLYDLVPVLQSDTNNACLQDVCNTAQGNEIDINSLWDQEMCSCCCLCFLVVLKQKKCTHKKNRLHCMLHDYFV